MKPDTSRTKSVVYQEYMNACARFGELAHNFEKVIPVQMEETSKSIEILRVEFQKAPADKAPEAQVASEVKA